MRLIIREYLSMLKESGELDNLLVDLLFAMSIEPLSKAQVGIRQYGVDVAARGIDPNDGVDKLFLFTVKKDNITRGNWNNNEQDVRPSLEEILDVYITKLIDVDHRTLPKLIILCCNGNINQNVEINWKSFKEKNTRYGEIEFDFWGADKLSILIERYLFNEYLFSDELQKLLRKTIALADQNEEEPLHFYRLIENSLFNKPPLKQSKAKKLKLEVKSLSILNLSLNIIFHWCSEANNLRPAFFSAERCLLRTWDWLHTHGLLEEKKVIEKYHQIFHTYRKVMRSFIKKIQPYCIIEHGLFGHAEMEEIEYPLRMFEIIGILGSFGIMLWNSIPYANDKEKEESCLKELEATAQTLAALIQNNPAASTPLYDNHSNDIVLGLILLTVSGYIDDAKFWIVKLSTNIVNGYKIGFNFPIHTNSFSDLLAILARESQAKNDLTKASTIIPILADWYIICNMVDEYEDFSKHINQTFSHTNFMLWVPDESSESFLYSTNAGYESGVGVSLSIHQSFEDTKNRIIRLKENTEEVYQTLSCFSSGYIFLAAIASRHYRTPVIPYLWQQLVKEN